jgi:hypothetical protein
MALSQYDESREKVAAIQSCLHQACQEIRADRYLSDSGRRSFDVPNPQTTSEIKGGAKYLLPIPQLRPEPRLARLVEVSSQLESVQGERPFGRPPQLRMRLRTTATSKRRLYCCSS